MEEKDKRLNSVDFLIKVKFRQNNTWQGEIQWLDQKSKGNIFFSFLEMILLMKEAIDQNNLINTEASHYRSWGKWERSDAFSEKVRE